MNHSDKESIITEIKKKIKSDRLKKDEKKFIFREVYKYAAIVEVSICVGYYLDNSKISSEPIRTDTSWLLASIGGTEASPLLPL